LSFRINKTVQKRTQNEPKRTQNEPNFRGYSAQAGTPMRKNRATRGTNLKCPFESVSGSCVALAGFRKAVAGYRVTTFRQRMRSSLAPSRLCVRFAFQRPAGHCLLAMPYWLLHLPSPPFSGKTNPTCPLESTKRCKNEPKTNPNEPKTNPTFEGIRPRPTPRRGKIAQLEVRT